MLKQASVPRTPEGSVAVRISDGKTFGNVVIEGRGAFGDVVTANLTPTAQVDFVYGHNTENTIEEQRDGGGSSYSTGMASVTSGASIGGFSRTITKRTNKYRPGMGSLFRFTALFGSPVLGVSQLAGAFSCSTNALLVGYDHTNNKFGFLRRHSGQVKIQELEITTGAGGAETVTITLNSVVFNVPVTAGTTAHVAQEISEFSFNRWVAEASGSKIIFMADEDGPRSGTYTISSTGTTAGTMTSIATGTSVVDEWHYQENWNNDKFDGTGPSKTVLDQTKGNVYAISMQYLGFGGMRLYIEDPETTKLKLAHTIQYANANIIPNMPNPTFAVGVQVENISSGTNVETKTASLASFVEGDLTVLGPPGGFDADGTTGARTPVLSIRNSIVMKNGTTRVNLRELVPNFISASTTGNTKPVKISVIKNGTLTNPLWTDYDITSSAAIDTSATAITGGTLVITTTTSKDGSVVIRRNDLDIFLEPQETLSIVVEPTGVSTDYTASMSWRDDI